MLSTEKTLRTFTLGTKNFVLGQNKIRTIKAQILTAPFTIGTKETGLLEEKSK